MLFEITKTISNYSYICKQQLSTLFKIAETIKKLGFKTSKIIQKQDVHPLLQD